MKKYIVFVLSLLLTTPAFASVGVKNNDTEIRVNQTIGTAPTTATDINVKGVTNLRTDGSTVTLDMTAIAATGGTIDNVTIGATTPALLSYLTPVTIIASTPNTVGAVTLAKSGYMYVLTATSGETANGWMLSLPSTNSTTAGLFTGQTYTFTSATGSTLAIRVPSATDATISYGNLGAATVRLTSPASSGSTVTLVGSGRVWYVASMTGYNSGGPSTWTAGTTA